MHISFKRIVKLVRLQPLRNKIIKIFLQHMRPREYSFSEKYLISSDLNADLLFVYVLNEIV